HTISFQGSSRTARLVVATEETPLSVLVGKIETGLNKPENAAKKLELSAKLNRLTELSQLISTVESRLKNNTSPNPQQDNDQLSLYVMGDDEKTGLSKILYDL